MHSLVKPKIKKKNKYVFENYFSIINQDIIIMGMLKYGVK